MSCSAHTVDTHATSEVDAHRAPVDNGKARPPRVYRLTGRPRRPAAAAADYTAATVVFWRQQLLAQGADAAKEAAEGAATGPSTRASAAGAVGSGCRRYRADQCQAASLHVQICQQCFTPAHADL